MITRRRFALSTSAALASLGITGIPVLERAARAATSLSTSGRALVVIQLAGGNDGLNTVVPYSDSLYASLRPTIALSEGERLRLDERVALNSALAPLHERFGKGSIAVVQGVGYPKPDRSHFVSTAIWQTARLEPYREPSGWLGRAVEADVPNSGRTTPLVALGIGGGGLSPSLYAQRTALPSLLSLDAFSVQPDRRYPGDAPALRAAVDALYRETSQLPLTGYIRQVGTTALESSDALHAAAASYGSSVKYPAGSFGDQLRLVAQLLSGGIFTRVFHVTLGGFDTHANQKSQQRTLLAQLAQGISALLDDYREHGCGDGLAVMTYSEFGRRAKENGTAGTDHGAGSVVFLAGPQVVGGLYGPSPDLSHLEGGDVPFAVDFRTVYASVLRDFLGVTPEKVLGGEYPGLTLFKR
jgi:uncharacterized protein (DUF1501 family)